MCKIFLPIPMAEVSVKKQEKVQEVAENVDNYVMQMLYTNTL